MVSYIVYSVSSAAALVPHAILGLFVFTINRFAVTTSPTHLTNVSFSVVPNPSAISLIAFLID